MRRILGIGNALVDVVTFIESDEVLDLFSLPKGSMQLVDAQRSESIRKKIPQERQLLTSGGSVANTIHGLGMLGAGAGFIGSVGNDSTGDLFENDLKDAGVSTYLFRRDTATGTAITLISPDAQRTFATHLGAAVEMRAKDLSQETFEGYQIFYLEGYLITNYDLVDTACRMATRENMTIAVDLSSYNVVEENRDSFEKIIRSYADIVFANEDEARAFSGMPPAEALDYLSALCEIAVVKTGANGSILKKAGEIVQVDAVPVICNDTTGAGDLYASGFLYGFARGASLEQCGKYGSALAARVIEIPGARMDRERFLQIRNLIN